MDERSMTPGEMMVWSASFSSALSGGSKPAVAVRLATTAVQRLRELDITALPEPSQVAVREVRHANIPDAGDQPPPQANPSTTRAWVTSWAPQGGGDDANS